MSTPAASTRAPAAAANTRAPAATASTHAPSLASTAEAPRRAWLQPKCGCGGSPGLAGACPDCARKNLLGLQPKLAIGTPGDRYEHEADRAADSVLRDPQGSARPSLSTLPAPSVQREGEDRKKAPPDPVGEGLGVVAANLGDNNPAFGKFTEKLAADFMRQPPALSIGVPVFMGANYAFLWSMAMVNPAMRRNFDDFNLAMLPGIVPQFPVKTFTYRILNGAQTRFEFDFGLDATALLEAFNAGVLNTHLSSLKFDSSGRIDTAGSGVPSLSAMQVKLGLFSDGINLTGGFRNGISPYPLAEPGGGTVMAQTPPMPDLQPGRQDVRFTLNLDLVRLYQHFNPGKPNPLGPQIDVKRAAEQPSQAADAQQGSPAAAAAVQSTLASGGAPLEPDTRQFMESRFGHDFGRVRVHADAQAAASAQSVGARAYAVGADLVFGRGQYAPATPAGRHLLAHELAHVVQQRGAGPGLMQRMLSTEELDDFDTDAFALPVLTTYLANHGPGRIEDNNDSDDKARRIVRLWKGKKAPFVLLTAPQKILLIQEMQSGFTGNDDERGILALLLDAPPADLAAIFTAIDPKELDSDFQGGEEDVLRAFFDRNFVGGRAAALKGSRRLVARDAAPAKDGTAEADAAKAAAEQKAPVREGEKDLVVLLDPKLKVLADVLAANATIVSPTTPAALATVLAGVKFPIGTMYVLSHGDDSASVKIGSAWYTPEKLAAALAGKMPAGKEPMLVDFRGCRIGMSPPGMEAIRAALNAGAVMGSTCWMMTTPLGTTSFNAKEFAGRKPADQDKELKAVAGQLDPKPRACIIDRTAAAYIRAGGNMVVVWHTARRTTEFDQLYSKCQTSLTPKVVDPALVSKSQSSISHDCQLIRVDRKK